MFRVYRRLFISMLLLVTLNFLVNAQELPTTPPQATTKNETVSSDDQKQADKDNALKEKTASTPAVKEKFSPAIADNSFLIEEAYNQEPGVVQHVWTCAGKRQPQRDIVCSLTQEWPVTNLKHQFSYTVPYSSLNSNQYQGVGDVMLNYRYQWKGEEDWALIAPRFTLILPTGNVPKGLGTGSSGFQFNLPVSKRLSEKFVTHFNAGFTLLPKVKGEDANGNQFQRALSFYNVGSSVIYLAHKKFNLMMEYLTNFNSEFDTAGTAVRYKEQVLNPGFRFAIDIGELQLVPGVSVPVSFSQGERSQGLFLYLSVEHPFSKKEKK